jgi:hypothetical protein
MRFLPRHPGRYSPPPAVLALLAVEVLVTAVLLLTGVPWTSLLASAGPVIGVTMLFLSPTLQELGRRQPRLTVTVREDEGQEVIAPSRARPWPIDILRVVANEVDDARETMNRPAVLDNLTTLTSSFPFRPSEAQREQAKAEFEEKVEKFESELRDWLAEYVEAAREYADTFDLALLLRNAASGAFAEAVTVVLELPDSVEAVEDRPTLPPPPERPFYEPPRNQSISPDSAISQLSAARGLGRVFAEQIEPMRFPMDPVWKISDDGRELEASVGDVHPGRPTAVGEALLLRASGPGRHMLRWVVFSKSARKEANGTIVLEVPFDSPPRPAFGRLNGIRRFPDVPFVDEKGEVVAEVRDNDPPLAPEREDKTEEEGPLKTLREARAFAEWRALGLDPAHDGPDRSTVREAKRA